MVVPCLAKILAACVAARHGSHIDERQVIHMRVAFSCQTNSDEPAHRLAQNYSLLHFLLEKLVALIPNPCLTTVWAADTHVDILRRVF